MVPKPPDMPLRRIAKPKTELRLDPQMGWGTGMRIDQSAVTSGEELGLSDHLQAHLGADAAAAWAARKATGGQPMGGSTAGANQSWSCLELFCWIQLACFQDLDGGFL